MQHVAIDLGGRESQICIRNDDGMIVEERRLRTSGLAHLLGSLPRCRVVMETCSEAFSVADAALEAGHEVRVVPATLVRSLGVGARRTKTDRRDAQVLSEVSCRIDLPTVHVPTAESRRRKTLCGMREALVGARTQLVNSVHGWLRSQAKRPRSGKVETFPTRLRTAMSELPGFVERQLRTIERLNEEIADADQELDALVESDPVCRRLQSVPGVGPVTAIRFVATIDDVSRFASSHQLESYLGLVPGENSSSERKHRLSITKAGCPALRRTLVQAAWAARRARGLHPMVAWSHEVEKRRGKHVAAVALARKLAGILFAIWRDGTTYDPRMAATWPTQRTTHNAADAGPTKV